MDYNKMKVNDLKVELANRNLDTKGVKAVLVERLKEAIEKEGAGNAAESTPTVAAGKKLDVGTPNQSTPMRRSRRRSMTRSPSPTRAEASNLESVSEEPEQSDSSELGSRKKRRTRSITKSPSPVKSGEAKRLEVLEEEPDTTEKPSEATTPKKGSEPESPEKRQVSPVKQATPAKASPTVTPTKPSPTSKPADTKDTKPSPAKPETPTPAKSSPAKPETPTAAKPSPVKPETPTAAKASPAKPETPTVAKPSPAKPETPTAAKPSPAKSATPVAAKQSPAKPATPISAKSSTDVVAKESTGQEAKPELPKDRTDSEQNETTETKSESNDKEHDEQETSEDGKEQGTPKAVKRKSSSPGKESPSKTPRTKPNQVPIVFVAEENEPEIDNDKFALSWFDSDLNLEIDSKTFDTGKPLSDGALALVWAGARANLGVTKGKVAYEVILTKANEMRKVTEEPVSAEFRVGWSTGEANLQLGEAKHSFAYTNLASKGSECKFSEYGVEYKVNDVVGVYLDLDSSPCKIEYTVNNVNQGVAFEFDKADLAGQALFPHVCSKNIAFKVNFGQLERSLLNDREKPKKEAPSEQKDEKLVEAAKENKKKDEKPAEAGKEGEKKEDEKPASDEKQEDAKPASDEKTEKDETKPEPTEKPQEEKKQEDSNAEDQEKEEVFEEQFINSEYIYIAKSSKENLVTGVCRPDSRKDCEVIFLIGLPASGKTHWVQNYLTENPDKHFTVLSVDTLLDRMKVSGEPRLPSNTNKWSRLVEQLARSLNKLNEIAAKRRRNFILDQTNVFASEQRRRLRGFGEYAARRAIVVVPEEEEYNRRLKLKSDKFGTEVQENNANAMKAHIYIPTLEQGWFTEITYAEQEEEKARATVATLNEIGRKALPRPNRNQQQQQRRGANNNQRWNQGYGNNRFSNQNYQQGGYNPQQRYNNAQQYSQNRNYRPGNGYGRREAGGYGVARYGNQSDWTRNSGRYDNRYNNRGYQNNQNRRVDYRGYNSGSGWNQQNSNCWSYGSQGNDTQQWYSWWQSNLKNLLQQQGGSGSDNSAQQANMEQYWAQYAQQHNYGNYQQSKSHGSGSSSKNK